MSDQIDQGDPMTNIVARVGDGDPFPYLKARPSTLAGISPQSGKFLGVGEYRCYQSKDTVFVTAAGGAPLNVKVVLEQSLTGEFPPAFALVFFLPEGDLLEQKSFVVQRTFHAAEPVATVRIKDADGWHEIPVEQGSSYLAGFDVGNA